MKLLKTLNQLLKFVLAVLVVRHIKFHAKLEQTVVKLLLFVGLLLLQRNVLKQQ